jgi:hypothetical protein
MGKLVPAAFFATFLVSTMSATAADTPKLHLVEALCITYQISGQMMEGTNVQCHRQYGHETYRLETTKIKIPGFAQTQSKTTVTVGADIYAINRDAGTATKTKNPMYDGMAKSAGTDPAEFLRAMGMSPTGTTEEILGLRCTVYQSTALGDMCMTDDGITLRSKMPSMTMTATEVRRDEGDPAIYALPGQVEVKEGPDLSQGIQGLMKQYRK